MSSEEELESMIKFLNEKAFREPGDSRLELRIKKRPDLGGALAFVVMGRPRRIDIGRNTAVMPIPPVTLCWGGGDTVESACGTALRKLMSGGDLVRKYIPFTFGSFDELKVKAAAYYG